MALVSDGATDDARARPSESRKVLGASPGRSGHRSLPPYVVVYWSPGELLAYHLVYGPELGVWIRMTWIT